MSCATVADERSECPRTYGSGTVASRSYAAIHASSRHPRLQGVAGHGAAIGRRHSAVRSCGRVLRARCQNGDPAARWRSAQTGQCVLPHARQTGLLRRSESVATARKPWRGTVRSAARQLTTATSASWQLELGGRRMLAPPNKAMKLTKLSPAPLRGWRCRLMPAPARERGHRFAAYRRCSADT